MIAHMTVSMVFPLFVPSACWRLELRRKRNNGRERPPPPRSPQPTPPSTDLVPDSRPDHAKCPESLQPGHKCRNCRMVV